MQAIDNVQPVTEAVIELKANLVAQYYKRFEHVESVNGLAGATLLDPRFKAIYLQPLAHAKILKEISDQIEFCAKKKTIRSSGYGTLTAQLAKRTVGHPWEIGKARIIRQ